MAKKAKQVQWTLDSFRKEARRLRDLADKAERELLLFLVMGEPLSFWHNTGLTYPAFLAKEEFADEDRYRAFKVSLERFGEAEVMSVGVHATVQAGKTQDRTVARDIIDEAKKNEEVNKKPVSARTAQRIARERRGVHIGQQQQHVTTSYVTLYDRNERVHQTNDQLRSQLEALRLENKQLRAENKQLKAENKQLKRELQQVQHKAQRTAQRGMQHAPQVI